VYLIVDKSVFNRQWILKFTVNFRDFYPSALLDNDV